jgi:Flp pilus assembly protein TadD
MAVRVSALIVCTFLFAGSNAFSQMPREMSPFPDAGSNDQGSSLRGEIIHERGTRLDNLFVEVQAVGGAGMSQRVPIDPTGEFLLSGLGTSSYVLKVTDMTGNVITEQVVSPTMNFIQVKLPTRMLVRPPSGTISLFELAHKIPSNALKEAKQADKCLVKSRDLPCYVTHARKALDFDPDYLGARRNLAIAYLKQGEIDKVLTETGELLKRDPHSFVGYALSSVAYLERREFAAAERAARQALSINSTDPACRYYLGVSLQMQSKDDAEALRLLEKTAPLFPKAHLSAAAILERTGQKDAARSELEQYLKSDEKDVREDVHKWLSSLN